MIATPPDVLILGIETSCDEPGVALYDDIRGLVGHVLHTQAQLHADSGGVVELRVDGVPEGIYSGDTKPGTAATIDKLHWNLEAGVGMQLLHR